VNSTRRTARATGVAYLALAVTGMVGYLYVRQQLYVPDDAAATAARLAGREGLARLGIVADLGMVVAQTVTAVGFWQLFRRVHPVAAGSIAAFGLVNAIVGMVSTACTAIALDVVLTGDAAAPGQALLLYRLVAGLWAAGAVFFGLWLIPMGWLVLRSAWMPRPLGHVLVVGGVGYVISAFVGLAAPDLRLVADLLAAPASVGEFWMVGYLLVRGVRERTAHAAHAVPAGAAA
jgi:hypothetical protein